MKDFDILLELVWKMFERFMLAFSTAAGVVVALKLLITLCQGRS